MCRGDCLATMSSGAHGLVRVPRFILFLGFGMGGTTESGFLPMGGGMESGFLPMGGGMESGFLPMSGGTGSDFLPWGMSFGVFFFPWNGGGCGGGGRGRSTGRGGVPGFLMIADASGDSFSIFFAGKSTVTSKNRNKELHRRVFTAYQAGQHDN